MTTTAEQVMLTIIQNNLLHAQCTIDPAHPCLVIWSSGAVEQIDALLADMGKAQEAEINRLRESEKCLEREVQSALGAMPTEFVGNDAWQNGIMRMASEIFRLRQLNDQDQRPPVSGASKA